MPKPLSWEHVCSLWHDACGAHVAEGTDEPPLPGSAQPRFILARDSRLTFTYIR